MGKFTKHLGKDSTVEIDGEKFFLKPLSIEDLPDFFEAMKAFKGVDENSSMEDMVSKMDKDGLKALARLVKKVMAVSYPDEPEEERNSWAMRNMGILIGKIFEMNTPSQENIDKKQIEKLKNKK